MRFTGDDHLSAQDRHLWSMCYSTLQRFGCPTIFKVRGPYVPAKVDQYITFFVPGTHPLANEAKTYLEEELRQEARVGQMMGEDYAFGCQVKVEFFSGVDGYLTHEECEPMREKFVEDIMRRLTDRKPKNN